METPQAQTSTAAILSLVAGIASWVLVPVLGAIVAIVCGHLARGEIRRQPQLYTGDGLAIAGLVLGYANLAVALVGLVLVFVVMGGIFAAMTV